MGAVTEQKEIDGLTFEVTQLTGWKTLRMFRRLGAALGPAFGELAQAIGVTPEMVAGKELGDMDVRHALPALGAAIPKLFEAMSEAELEGIARGLLETAFVVNPDNGSKGLLLPQFDLIMQGRVGTIFKLVGFAIQLNYGSFFNVAAEFARPHLVSKRRASVASPAT